MRNSGQESRQADPPPESEPREHMNALVPVFMHDIADQQVQATNLRELHGNLKNGDHFPTWIKDRIRQYGFVEGRDFVTFSVIPENGGRRVEYYGTLSMGKELAMVENNDRGRMIRR
jgi:anti-repressor protein